MVGVVSENAQDVVASPFLSRVRAMVARPRTLMVIAWFAQFVLMLLLFFFQGVNTAHGLVTLTLTPERLVEILGFADAGSYLQGAQNLIASGRITPEWAWVLNLWPPGMVWLDAVVLYASPLPFGTSIALISALVWSLALAILAWPFLRSPRAALVVFAAELAILSTSPFQSWMLDEWFLYADGLAVATFLIGLGILVNRVRTLGSRQVWIRDGVFAGTAFAAMVYLRASYQLIPWMLAAIGVLLVVLILARRRRGAHTEHLMRQFIFIAAAVGSVVLLLAPYMVYSISTKNTVQLVQTEDLVYQHVWEQPGQDNVPQWMVDGGSSLGCDLDRVTCDLVHERIDSGDPMAPQELRDRLIGAVLANPGEFVINRVHYVVSQWFADELQSYSHVPGDYASGAVSHAMSKNLNPPQNLLYLGLLVVAVGASVVLVRRGNWILLIIAGSALALLAPFSFVHVEVRYLIPIKLLGLFAPVLVMMMRERKARPATESILIPSAP